MDGETFQPQEEPDRWMQAIAAQPGIARDMSGRGFLYKRGRVLLHPDVITGKRTGSRHAHGLLREAGAREPDPDGSRLAEALGLAMLHFDDQVAAPALVRELRRAVPSSASLEHVLVADPHRFYGCDPAEPADKPDDIPGTRARAGEGLTVAVLDTGVWSDSGLPVEAGPDDAEILDEDGDGLLDPPAGHGTFVAGVILRYAPGATVIARRLLKTPAGLASELEVAAALLDLPEVDVINCSFGGPSQEDAAPLAIEHALAQLSPKTVVVAAAGNQGDPRPHWPAASKRAIGVASVVGGKGSEGWELAEFSSRGPWVDACAPGSDVHSRFVDFTETGVAPSDRAFIGGAKWSGTSFAAPAVTGAILALASRDGIPVKEAVYRLIDAPTRQRIFEAGTLVVPDHLPPTP